MQNRNDHTSKRQRNIKKQTLSLLAAIALLFISPTATKALSYPKYILYLTGTSLQTTEASSFQSDWTWIAQSMRSSARLNIPMSNQIIINYTNDYVKAGTVDTPAVISSFNSGPPTLLAGCRNTAGGIIKGMVDGWAHAVSTAWRIRDFIVQTTTPSSVPQIIIIGHSQGGTIARMIQLVTAGKTNLLPSDLPSKCWPTATLSGKIKGIVGMGAPLAKKGQCPDFDTKSNDALVTERAYTHDGAATPAGKVMMIGATPKEIVNLFGYFPNIDNNCSTMVTSSGSTRVNIFGKGYPNKITSLTVSTSVIYVNGIGYRDATMTTSNLHNMSVGSKFKISGAVNASWEKTWTVRTVEGTTQRIVTFRVPSALKTGEAASPSLKTTDDQVQDHGWWIEGKGRCPAGIIKPGRGDGNAPIPFCGYVTIVNGSTASWPTVFTTIDDLASPGNPGTVYDLIATTIKTWWA